VRVLDLFSGIGGFSLGLERAGFETVAFCEYDKAAQKVLKLRWPNVPIFDDIRGIAWALQSQSNADRAAMSSTSTSASPIEKNTAHGHAEHPACAGITAQTLAGGNGCSETTTQTGRAERKDQEAALNTQRNVINGADLFTQETDIHARSADSSEPHQTNSTRTTSNHGQKTQTLDSTLITESHYAEIATWRSTIDVITAGFPCQPASVAGKRRGTEDDRWLFPALLEVIQLVKPTWCILENVRGLLTLEGGVVFERCISELEASGYEVQPFIIPACAVDAKHRRDRVWIICHAKHDGSFASRNQQELPREPNWTQTEIEQFTGSGEQRTFLANAGGAGRGEGLLRDRGDNEQSPSQGRSVEFAESSEAPALVADADAMRELQSERGKQDQRGRVGDGGKIISNSASIRRPGQRESIQWRGNAQGGERQADNAQSVSESRIRAAEPRLGRELNGLSAWLDELGLPKVSSGVPKRADRLKQLGNAVVPQIPYIIGRAIMEAES